MPSTTLSGITRCKRLAFGLLEHLSDLRGNAAKGHFALTPAGADVRPALWVFVSTIGELNAIDPLLRVIVDRMPQVALVLITDHPHYRDGYLARYPQGQVCVTRGHGSDAQALARTRPPRMLVVAEIPCWPGDAPCRFASTFVFEAKLHGATAAIVNGWLYHYPPASRMDDVERRLFQRDYLRAFDAIAVQTEETRQHLLAAGADGARIAVTGNIKFDAMQRSDWTPAAARSPTMLGALISSGRPTVVAGCVTNFEEQTLLLDAFTTLRKQQPDALLILAPRHPEVVERMQTLREYLAERGLPAVFKSTLPDVEVAGTTACVVLDTMGELRDFYAAATVAHVGVDHNVLEPMAFGKPVSVVAGWDTTYPSYPVYRMLFDADALLEVRSAGQLAGIWQDLLVHQDRYHERIAKIEGTLQGARGAVARHLALLEKGLLPSPARAER